jgi:hypothetical protein
MDVLVKGDLESIYGTQGRGRVGVSQGLLKFLEGKFNALFGCLEST